MLLYFAFVLPSLGAGDRLCTGRQYSADAQYSNFLCSLTIEVLWDIYGKRWSFARETLPGVQPLHSSDGWQMGYLPYSLASALRRGGTVLRTICSRYQRWRCATCTMAVAWPTICIRWLQPEKATASSQRTALAGIVSRAVDLRGLCRLFYWILFARQHTSHLGSTAMELGAFYFAWRLLEGRDAT